MSLFQWQLLYYYTHIPVAQCNKATVLHYASGELEAMGHHNVCTATPIAAHNPEVGVSTSVRSM